MLFSAVDQLKNRKEADLIVLPFWQIQKKSQYEAKPAAHFSTFHSAIEPALISGDFEANASQMLLVYLKGNREKRCLLLGLGKEEELTVEKLRQAYAHVAKECQRKAISSLNLILPTISQLRTVRAEDCLKGIAEGILLVNYRWEKLAALDEETVLLKSVCLVGVQSKFLAPVKECEQIAEGVYLSRDLINGNADIITPQYLAETARKIANKFPAVKATVLDQKNIEKEQMGLFLAVARGSAVEPAFIILNYKGQSGSKDHTVLIGKGITFDTGGLNLKPTGGMETMRGDMAGAAAVMATIAVIAALDLKINVTAVVAAAENAIDAKSYKPGDVHKGCGGITVEVGNTDAEGRLTLADALAYSIRQFKPTRIIDLATLTGSIVIALGEGIAGLFCNNENLANALLESGHRTAETLWRMPLYAPYKEQIKSDIADLKNTGGKPAGPITAALFLQEFVQNIPWAHIDIAGPAFGEKERGYWPRNGVGYGVRLLTDFLIHLPKKS